MALPTLDVQFAPSAVASAGRSFILDISTLGTNTDPAVDLTGGTLAEGAVFKDISPYVRSFTTDRGRRRSLDRFGAGTATVVLDNRDRRFDPTNFSSEYANSILGITGVTPMRPVIINATWSGTSYPIFRGFIDSWSFDYDQSISDATATITLTDAFKVLAGPLGSLPTAPGFTVADYYDRIPSSAEVLIATADGDGLNVVPMTGTSARLGFVTNITVGSGATASAYVENTQRLYVMNASGNSVSVVNTASNAVAATVSTGTNPSGIAAHPYGTQVITANYGSNNVTIISTATNAVLATTAVGTQPAQVVYSLTGDKAYVLNSGSANVSVINTSTYAVSSTIAVGTQPVYAKGLSPDGTRLIVGNYASSTVSIINTATDTVVATPSTTTGSSFVSFLPNSTKAYVTCPDGDNVKVITMASNTVTATITVGDNPRESAITPDGTKLFVVNRGSNTCSIIDTTTDTVVASPTCGTYPYSVIVNTQGTRAYVGNFSSSNVTIIDTATNAVVDTLGTLSTPGYLNINNSGTRIYALASNKVNVLADQSANLGTFNIPVVEGVEQTPAYGAENEKTGQRIFRLLDEVGMQRSDIDEGNVRLIPQKVDATVLEMMQIAAESEPGDLFVDASGQIRFDDRYALIENTKSNTTQGTFDTTTLSNPFATVEVAYDDDLLYNIIKTTRYTVDPTKTESENPVLLGTTVTVSNPESQALYGARTLERRLPVPTDFGDDTTYGQDYLRDYGTFLMSIYSQPELRPASIRIMPQRSETTLFPQVLDREINDRIVVKFSVPGGGTIEKSCFIDGVSHDVTPESWSTSFNLRSATQYTGFFILDSATVGLLDTNKLAF